MLTTGVHWADAIFHVPELCTNTTLVPSCDFSFPDLVLRVPVRMAVSPNRRTETLVNLRSVCGSPFACLPALAAVFDHTSPGGTESCARGINDAGQVAGFSDVVLEDGSLTQHAFVWADGVMTDLGTLGGRSSQAFGINNLGQVVGWSQFSPDDAGVHAFLWADGLMVDLGTIGGGPDGNSMALAINDSSASVGWSDVRLDAEAVAEHAFLAMDSEMTDLGTIGDQTNGSSSNAIGSGAGHVVGNALGDDRRYHAFVWTDSDGMIDLGSLQPGWDTVANGIDDSGAGDRVVGWSGVRAFIWSDGEMRELFPTTANSLAYAINSRGQVVGYLQEPPGPSAGFLFTDGEVTTIPSLGGRASVARAINNVP